MRHRKNSPLGVVGTSGLRRYGGMGQIYEESLRNLRGYRGSQAITEMLDNSTAVGAIDYAIRTLVQQATWRVEPASEAPEALAQAAFVESCLGDMQHTWMSFLDEALTYLGYGWACLEIIYKLRKGDTRDPTTNSRYEDGLYGWRKFALRGQDTLHGWEWDEDTDDLVAMVQSDSYSGSASTPVIIPIHKLVHLVCNSTKQNPQGKSLYRNAYISYYEAKCIETVENIGIERDLVGLPHMTVPKRILLGATAEDAAIRANLEQQLAALKVDEQGFILDTQSYDAHGNPEYGLELLGSPGKRQFNTTEILQRKQGEILQTCLAQFLRLGQQGSAGSRAVATSGTTLFSKALGATLDYIAEEFTRQAIHRLMALNKVHRDLWPTLGHSEVETPPLDEMSRYVSSLAGVGINMASPAVSRKLLEIAKLPVDSGEPSEPHRQARPEEIDEDETLEDAE